MRGKRSNRNVVSVIEAAYAVERSDVDWLDGVVAAAEPDLARDFGALAYAYDASSIPIRVLGVANRGAPFSPQDIAGAVATADEPYVDQTWRAVPFAAGSETPGFRQLPVVRDFFYPRGVRDFIAVNGFDTSGLGVWVGAPRSQEIVPTPAERRTWARVASHLVAALRLRRRGRLSGAPSAVLSPDGKIEHADGDAKLEASRRALCNAARRVESARGPLRRRDPAGAVELWRALVEGRWSLVDRFESGGRRYVVAVENEPAAPGPDALTARERQVVAASALGRSTKLVAYEMGLSDATVRVLLARAAKKLGVHTRRELLALYLAHVRGGLAE